MDLWDDYFKIDFERNPTILVCILEIDHRRASLLPYTINELFCFVPKFEYNVSNCVVVDDDLCRSSDTPVGEAGGTELSPKLCGRT